MVLSIVIPVYNEEKFIATTIDRVLHAKTSFKHKEIIIIDDASTDKTISIIKAKLQKIALNYKSQLSTKKNITSLKTEDFSIQLIAKKQNDGKGATLKIGLQSTTGDIVIIQDADLEYQPEEYSLLLEPFRTSAADVVYGSRFITHRPHRVLYFWHYVANVFLTTLSNMFTNLNLTDMETGYKAFKGEIIRTIAPKLQSKRFGFEPEITARIAKIKEIKLYEVGISYYGRTYGEGKKISWKDGLWAIGVIIKYNVFSRN